jgi:hypothetical protein
VISKWWPLIVKFMGTPFAGMKDREHIGWPPCDGRHGQPDRNFILLLIRRTGKDLGHSLSFHCVRSARFGGLGFMLRCDNFCVLNQLEFDLDMPAPR